MDCTSSSKEDKIQLTYSLTQQSVKCQSLQKLPTSFHYLIFRCRGLTQMTLSKQFGQNKTQCLLNRRPATYSEALYRKASNFFSLFNISTKMTNANDTVKTIPTQQNAVFAQSKTGDIQWSIISTKRYRNHHAWPCDAPTLHSHILYFHSLKNELYRNHENRPCDVTGTLLSDERSIAIWHVTAQSSYSVQRS
jgi:hypothetical protein